MTCAFIDGFDADSNGTRYATYTGALTIVSGRDGVASAVQLAATPSIIGRLAAADEHGTIIVGFAARFSAATPGQIATLRSDAGATIHVAVEWDGDQLVFKRGAGGTTLGTTSGVIPTAEWVYVEIRCVLHDSTGQLSCRVGNTSVLALTGIDTKNAGTKTVFDSFGFENSGGTTWRLDDLYVNNAAGTVNNSFNGDSRVATLLPNGNGTYSDLVGSDGDSVNNYLLVDDPTAPAMSDYVLGDTSGEKDTYAFPDIPTVSPPGIAAVQTVFYADWVGTAVNARPKYRIGGADYSGSDVALASSPATYRQISETSPATAVAWTEAELSGAEFGFEVRP